jgi:hypothetical protein
MKDKRVKWVDTRWGKSLSIPIFFLILSLLSYFFKFIDPSYVELRPSIFGETSLFLVMCVFMILFGMLFWVLFSLLLPKYCEYVTKKSPYLIPYLNNEVCSYVPDHKKVDITWESNKTWIDTMTICTLDGVITTQDKDGNTFYVHDNDTTDILINMENKVLHGWFTYVRNYGRYGTFYSLKFVGKV